MHILECEHYAADHHPVPFSVVCGVGTTMLDLNTMIEPTNTVFDTRIHYSTYTFTNVSVE
jgi:hypothetical protein